MDPPNQATAEEVGIAFVNQYYFVLEHWPEEIYRVYKDDCEIARRGKDGNMRKSTFLDTDANDLNTISAGGFDSVEITSFDSEDAVDETGIVIVNVRGCFNASLENNFSQTFFLAPQENGYLVSYDYFRFVYTGDELNQDSRELTETICIRNLPPNCTKLMVRNKFKKFGAIKAEGIAIRTMGDNTYGFVEYKAKDYANLAIEASQVQFGGGHKVDVEKMRAGGYLEQMKICEEELQQKLNRIRREKFAGVDNFLEWHKLIIDEMGETRAYDFWGGQKSMESKQTQEIEEEQKSMESKQTQEIEEEQKSTEEQSKPPQEIEDGEFEEVELEDGYEKVEAEDEEEDDDEEEDGFYMINAD